MKTKKQDYAQIAQAVIATKDDMQGVFDWCAKRIKPRQKDIVKQISSSLTMPLKQEHCAAAAEAEQVLAGAHCTYIVPANQKWMRLEDENETINKRYAAFYEKVTEKIFTVLAQTNFYTQFYCVASSRCTYGTGLMLCEEDRSLGVRFVKLVPGTYGIAENAVQRVDTVCRRFEYTPHQAVDAWGLEALPDVVKSAYAKDNQRFSAKFPFLHLVTPRKSYTQGNGDSLMRPEMMRFASVYMYDGSGYPVIMEGGYPEFPFLATRYLDWGDSVWGCPPAIKAFFEINSLIKSERNLDTREDLEIFPRIQQLAEQIGEIDYRAGGRTVISERAAQMGLPREWMPVSGGQRTAERIADKEEKIRAAFCNNFLQVISGAERQMTATEVVARQEEQILSFSSTFTQFIDDFNVLLERIFSVLYRQGEFNFEGVAMPDSLVVPDNDGTQNFSVKIPKVVYLGKISQAIDRAQQMGLEYFLQVILSLVQATQNPALLDRVKMDEIVLYIYKMCGGPADLAATDEEVQAIRGQRAEQEAMAMQMQQMQQGAAAIKDLKQ